MPSETRYEYQTMHQEAAFLDNAHHQLKVLKEALAADKDSKIYLGTLPQGLGAQL